MGRANIDITGAGPHILINPAADEHVRVTSLLLTFAHASPDCFAHLVLGRG